MQLPTGMNSNRDHNRPWVYLPWVGSGVLIFHRMNGKKSGGGCLDSCKVSFLSFFSCTKTYSFGRKGDLIAYLWPRPCRLKKIGEELYFLVDTIPMMITSSLKSSQCPRYVYHGRHPSSSPCPRCGVPAYECRAIGRTRGVSCRALVDFTVYRP